MRELTYELYHIYSVLCCTLCIRLSRRCEHIDPFKDFCRRPGLCTNQVRQSHFSGPRQEARTRSQAKATRQSSWDCQERPASKEVRCEVQNSIPNQELSVSRCSSNQRGKQTVAVVKKIKTLCQYFQKTGAFGLGSQDQSTLNWFLLSHMHPSRILSTDTNCPY